jgi:diadenosine tetraphosphate (Ap4A) HIT family hydrolase
MADPENQQRRYWTRNPGGRRPERALTVLNDCFLCADWNRDPARSGISQILGRKALDEAFLWESEDLYLTPALGCITPGYLILAPKQHYISFAQVPNGLLTSAKQLWMEVNEIGTGLGLPGYVLFEHGAATRDWRGAACIEHAHLHLVPSPDHVELNRLMETEYPQRQHSGFEDIRTLDGGPPYVLLMNSRGIFSYQTPEIASQYLRKHIAAQWEVPDKWNWRLHPFGKNFWRTIDLFSGLSLSVRSEDLNAARYTTA